jgi:hypothetical protein
MFILLTCQVLAVIICHVTRPSNLSNLDVVVLALFRLGGDKDAKDTEDIAFEVNRLAPGRFVWKKYPDQISLEHVRVFLSDAKKAKNGRLVSGDGTNGWQLTRAGLDLAMEKSKQVTQALPSRPRVDKLELRRRRIESARLLELPAWSKFKQNESVKLREAEEVFRVGDYVRGERRARLVDRIRILFIDDSDLGPFVELMAQMVQEGDYKNG